MTANLACRIAALAGGVMLSVSACSSAHSTLSRTSVTAVATAQSPPGGLTASSKIAAPATGTAKDMQSPGQFTFSFAGDVHFAGRTADRLAADPATVFGEAQPGLAAADLTMVNLETAITSGGQKQGKEFTFSAPPVALTALRDGGVDVATMANNHGADYGASGLRDSLAAIAQGGLPVIGIGKDAAQAFAPWVTTVRGTKIAVLAATQVKDETLAHFSASDNSAGVASAFSPKLIAAVQAAKASGAVVIVYVHWGTEFVQCPNADQQKLAAQLAAAGATAVIETHAHVLQGAGWRSDGTYVAYGLGNYLWWRSFDSVQDDNGVLTLTFDHAKVVANVFAPSRLDGRGVPVPAAGATATRIQSEWDSVRDCAHLSPRAP